MTAQVRIFSMSVCITGDIIALSPPLITGSRFICQIDALTKVGPYDAVVPAIAGQAWITGLYQMGMDSTDPYSGGLHALRHLEGGRLMSRAGKRQLASGSERATTENFID